MVIKKNSYFNGAYYGSGDLQLEGAYEGTLRIDTLHVKQNGSFKGNVIAQQIIVEGELNADIETEVITLKKTGIIDGDLLYRDLIIESGGLLKSTKIFNMSKNNNVLKIKKNNLQYD